MERRKQIEEEVEKTLEAFDRFENVNSNPFMYTRIKARLESKTNAHKESSKVILLPTALLMLVLINVFTLFNTELSSSVNQTEITQEYLQELGTEYNLYETNYYSYNIE